MRITSGLAALLLCASFSAAPWSAVDAAVLPLGDDDTVEVVFTAGFSFPLFGTTHRSVFVNSNGSVSFGRGDIVSIPDLSAFLSGPPRIAALWADLDPSTTGTVSSSESSAQFSVTFDAVPLFGETEGNTFTITLNADGSFACGYGSVVARDGIAGLSGGGLVTGGAGSPIDLSLPAPPLGNGSRPDVCEVFTTSSPFDLSNDILPFRATWDYHAMFTSDTSTGDLLRLNGWTGASTVVGPTLSPNIQGLSVSPSATLYGVDNSAFPASAVLVTIDPVTGRGTPVGELGYPVVNSLAFSLDGSLYGMAMDPDIERTDLLSIDADTGVATVVAQMGSADISALTGAGDGELLAIDDDTNQLLHVDRATAAETPIGPLGHDRVVGLDRLPDGRLYAVRLELVIPTGFRTTLMTVDPTTGRASEIGSTSPAAGGGLGYRCATTNGGVELCDGLDNDCNGSVDEGFILGTPCTVGLGECARDGFEVCGLDGVGTVCDSVAGMPSPEICNGLDDDCDGDIEDDLDEDGDGWTLCDGDCNDESPGDILVPPEVGDLKLAGGWMVWQDLSLTAGTSTRYDVVAATVPDFSDAECVHSDLTTPDAPYPAPAPGPPTVVLYLLVGAQNGCGDGPYRTDPQGDPVDLPVGDCF